MIERVHIIEDWTRMGHQVVILGRAHPQAPVCWLTASGQWEPLQENARAGDDVGFRFPEGALDALVAAHQKTTAPQPATERHLNDVMKIRDRLLAMIEVAYQPSAHMPAAVTFQACEEDQ